MRTTTPAPTSGRTGATPVPDGSPAAILAAPLVGTGVMMAAYLLLRPYGDATGGAGPEAAQAFASPWWVVSHLCGMLALASFARLALRLGDLCPGPLARAARWSGLTGVVLVLPYYGAETFALAVLGRAALDGGAGALELVAPVRDHPVAMTTFALGLLLLTVAGILVGLLWQRAGDPAAWPLAVLVALFLPQFFLPPVGRMGYGVLYAVAAALFLAAALRTGRSTQDGSAV